VAAPAVRDRQRLHGPHVPDGDVGERDLGRVPHRDLRPLEVAGLERAEERRRGGDERAGGRGHADVPAVRGEDAVDRGRLDHAAGGSNARATIWPAPYEPSTISGVPPAAATVTLAHEATSPVATSAVAPVARPPSSPSAASEAVELPVGFSGTS